MRYGPVEGNQPNDGTMTPTFEDSSLPGYENYGTIRVEYHIPNGLQGMAYCLELIVSPIDPFITFL